MFVQLSEQTSRLIRDELRLAQDELRETAKRAGRGGGLLAGAGAIALTSDAGRASFDAAEGGASAGDSGVDCVAFEVLNPAGHRAIAEGLIEFGW